MLDVSSQHAEGNVNRVLSPENNNKSQTPEPSSDKPACGSRPAAEGAKTQDYPSPQPIHEGTNSLLPHTAQPVMNKTHTASDKTFLYGWKKRALIIFVLVCL